MAKAHAQARNFQKKDTEFQEEVLAIDRVTRVVAGGRRLRFRATVVVGNRNGKVGLGIGKANEVIEAINKAIRMAKKNLQIVPMIHGTIPHAVEHKFKSARLLLMPATDGTGIIAGGAIRKVVELAGVKDILSKSFGTSNKIAAARATLEALSMFSIKAEARMVVLEEKKNAKKEASKSQSTEEVKKEEVAKKPSPKPDAAKKSAPKKAE